MASARKRPRAEPEDNRAECPFTIKIVDPKDKEQKKKKRRRTENGDEEDTAQRINIQLSPFAPCGKFKTHESMDLYYQVDPSKRWTDMTRYNSFVLNGIKYFSEGFIYVANDFSIERQKAVNNNEPMQPRKKSDDDWVARILEIRASDEHHVVWPESTGCTGPTSSRKEPMMGGKQSKARQQYHGMNELICLESYGYHQRRERHLAGASETVTVELVCSCNTPGNPDKMLIGCTTEACKKWMHEQCILDDALKSVYARLGTDKPHVLPVATKKEENGDEGKRPLSPSETGAEGSAEQSIDVKSEAAASDAVHVGTKDNVEVRQAVDDEDAQAAPEDSLPLRSADRRQRAASENTTNTDTPSKPASASKSAGRAQARADHERRGLREANGRQARWPWGGFYFEASLKTADMGLCQ
ncbi:hypothetical protein CHGG_01063 [Chaetomium globosum CBS 148.51]|uniref:Uncharacterized protein n=1 Tax=Chaetomium globosum (strain ATCC 6205 / CBS 148.51 / DSM 1962 / NBRC 6347 / NRRL 1970) TaxID=306901 RepID=Q2HFE1_CHAGB|nr:uncharacterized protein CHGG_01063 [Chaetomium globosum CBS 148.51]EAQ92828.1 hypothetical protein CHGG_01063 [Chaetomium globosum CBS 148.51]